MADHKPDAFGSTGAHRAWVGEGAPSTARALPPRDGARNWTNRPQPNARHAAITKSLFNFPSYKSWTEKVKTNWQQEKPQEKP
ncbi:MAG TPA: hypothetical protein VET48_00720 [Steroidobacteraceae bacterium]|nr:hypothetical protein [Steroidobacteraceae bacterium]